MNPLRSSCEIKKNAFKPLILNHTQALNETICDRFPKTELLSTCLQVEMTELYAYAMELVMTSVKRLGLVTSDAQKALIGWSFVEHIEITLLKI